MYQGKACRCKVCQDERIVDLCREWLTYHSQAKLDNRWQRVGVPAMRYDDDGGRGGSGDHYGAYLPALFEAQFYWAAKTLPPMLRDAAFQGRAEKDVRRVAAHCYCHHRAEWLQWVKGNPLRPARALIEECAQQMANKLYEDIIL